MELHLGLALSSSSSSASSCSSQFDNESIQYSKKRKYGNDEKHVPQTLPLLVWNNFCNANKFSEEDHDDHDGDNEAESNSIFVHQR